MTMMLIYWEVKGKAVPLQAWTGPEGSRKLIYWEEAYII